jgi:hypothetical protein
VRGRRAPRMTWREEGKEKKERECTSGQLIR